MWIITPTGFYSAVQSSTDDCIIVVRTRVYRDALTLAEFAVEVQDLVCDPRDLVVSYPASDYPWRVILDRAVWGQFVARQVECITYSNVKDAVKAGGSDGPFRATILARVWATLLGLTRLDEQTVAPDDDDPFGDGDDDDPFGDGDDFTLTCGCVTDGEILTWPCAMHVAPPF